MRRRVTPFFDGVSHCIETHGGTVEKFAGDAVMAAFGIPQAHEDDAERAVRAGARRSSTTSIELGLEARIGIESGEVVADETRLHLRDRRGREPRRAPPAGRRAGRDPHRPRRAPAHDRPDRARARRAARAARLPRARSPPIASSRAVDGVRAGADVSAPFVGRESELELLENTFDAHASRPAAARLHRLRRAGRRQEPPRPGVPRRRGGRHDARRARCFPTARASPTGRSPRWSSPPRASPTTTRWRRRSEKLHRVLRGRGDRRAARPRRRA